MTLKINSVAPDFTADTSEGKFPRKLFIVKNRKL